jgi:hypothetical protein
LLATVRYETEPGKSLALLKSGDKLEWFRQGEKAGHLDIDEICDGSVVFSQSGKNPQTLQVPPKPEGKSLLKGDQKAAVAASRPSGVKTVTSVIDVPEETEEPVSPSGSTPAPSRRISSRIQRTRAEPPAPTPEEQKAQLDSTISGIQEIMNRQDEGLTEEQRKAENETWMQLLNALKSEKENLQTAPAEPAPASPAEPAVKEERVAKEPPPAMEPKDIPANEGDPVEAPEMELPPDEEPVVLEEPVDEPAEPNTV